MGFLDDAKGLVDKGMDAAADHKDTIKDGIDKAAGFAKSKVGDEHDDKVDMGAEKAKEFVEGLEDEDA